MKRTIVNEGKKKVERGFKKRLNLAKTVQLRDAKPLIKIEQLLEDLIDETSSKGGFIALCTEEDFPIAQHGSIPKPDQIDIPHNSKLFCGHPVKHKQYVCYPFSKNEYVVGYVLLNPENSSLGKEKHSTILKLYSQLISKELELADKTAKLQYQNEKISRKQRQLKQTITFKNNILSLTTHDVRSPLNAVQGYLELLESYLSEKEFEDEEIWDYHGKITDGVNNIADLIEQLNEIALLELQRIDLNLVKVDLNWVIREVCNIMQGPALSKDQELIFDTTDEPVYAEIDIPKFKRVIFNLIGNGIKYTPGEGTIEVRLKAENDMALIEIEDSGMGIPDEKQKAIFEPFRKFQQQGTNGELSTGLGLFTSSYFTRLHKGSIAVDSEVGKGSVFSVHLPIVDVTF